MEKAILTYKTGFYLVNNVDKDPLLEKIAYFLRNEVGCHQVTLFKNILYNAVQHVVNCNEYRLEKMDDIIRISDDYIEDEKERLFYSVEIKRDELARVLDQWDEICKTMPPYVIITRDGDTVALHGCETLDEN